MNPLSGTLFLIAVPEFSIPPVKAIFDNHAHLPFPDGNLHEIRFQYIQNDGYKRTHIIHSNRNGLNDFLAIDLVVIKITAICQSISKYILILLCD
jgi:hypothetical protein